MPSCGELGYMIVRRKAIDDTISKLSSAYGIGVQVSGGGYYYWTSSEYSGKNARDIGTYNGRVDNNLKGNGLYVRAFMRL